MSDASSGGHTIEPAAAEDLPELLALMRAYCEFYDTAPSDEALLALSRTLLDQPEREGLQLIARDERGTAVGFATVFWSWDTTEASRVGIMHDLYVVPAERGRGLADALIGACLERCVLVGASRLGWETAPGNLRAQAVYDRVGAVREPWLVYGLAVTPARSSGGPGTRS
jgi:GNAT superfamily N-acetyltransferase